MSGLSGEAPEEQVADAIENNNKAVISLTVYNDGVEGISIEGPAGTTLSDILDQIYSWMDMGLVFGTGEDISFVINIYEDSTDADTAVIKYPVTINGNGHTISYTGTDRAIEIPNETGAAAVVINDLTVDCTASYCQRGINYNATGSLALDNVTVKGTAVTYALNLPGKANNCTVTINNSDISGCIALNVWGSDSTITATNTKFASVDNAEHENYSAVKLNNDGTTSAEGSVIEIVGGSISANDDSNAATNMTETGKIIISDTTTVDGDIVDMAAVVIYEGATDFYACTTLQNAMDQAANDPRATVKLIRDITLSESVTVEGTVVMDLNGKTIAGEDSETAKSFNLFVNKGNFTIKDSVGNGKITLEATTNRGWSYSSSIISNSAGILVVENGTLEHLGGTDMAYVIDNNSTLGETVTTVNGGTLVSPYRAIRLFQNSTADNIVNVTGGTISAKAGIWLQQPSSGNKVQKGTLNVTGGTFDCYSNAVVIDIQGAASSIVNISDGTFKNENANTNLLLIWPFSDMNAVSGAVASMNITGGDFTCAGEGKLIGILDGADANGDVVISGGTYSEEVSAYCADGYECAANGDGTYGIQVAQLKVAEVNGETYETIAAAIAAANDGDVITIIGAASDETLTVEKSVTITSDENNKQTLNNVHITASGTAVELTVTNLKFTGSSYINANNASALTVIGCEANVDPKKVTGRAAFIVPGTSELNNQPLLLKVKDNIILSAQSGTDYYSAAIFGWRYLADGTEISNNVMGSENERYTFVAVKTMNAMDGARFTFENNTIYGTNVPYVFVAFDLYQNNSRANTYTVLSKNNMIDVDTSGNNMYVVFYLEGNTGFNNNSNIILQDNGTTINGRAITMADIEASDLSSDYSKYYGVNVVTDAEGKLIAGCFSTDVSAYCAEGFKTEKNAEGFYSVVEEKAEEPAIMQKMLVIFNMEKKVDNKNPEVSYYPIHVYCGIDSLKYDSVGFKVKATNHDTNKVANTGKNTTKVYESMNVTQTDGTVKLYEASALGGKYMFGQEILFTVGNWANSNTTIEVTPYAVTLDGKTIEGATKVLTDAAIQAQKPGSNLFREVKAQ